MLQQLLQYVNTNMHPKNISSFVTSLSFNTVENSAVLFICYLYLIHTVKYENEKNNNNKTL